MRATEHHPTRNLEDFAEIASDWFWESDENHVFTYISKRVEQVLQISCNDVIGTKRAVLGRAKSSDPKWQAHLQDLDAHRPFKNYEYMFQRPTDGAELWLRIAGRQTFDQDGRFTGYRGTGNDITAEREAIGKLRISNATLAERNAELLETKRELERTLNRDSLTGLLNRRAFERDLREIMQVDGTKVIILHIDLDRFRWINETLGYTAGDHVLQAVADRLLRFAGGIGPVYRIDGDEFQIVLADNAESEKARWIADAIIDAMNVPIPIGRQQGFVSASIGMASGIAGKLAPRELIANADIALTRAKVNGRGCLCEVPPDLLEKMARRRRLSGEIPQAIENRQIIPFYQPQIDARSGQVIGTEALARWNHPDLGLLAPYHFLGIAAERGLTAEIDRSIMQQAQECAGRTALQGMPLSTMSVNLSAGRLMDPQLLVDIETLWATGPTTLTVELLETISLDTLPKETALGDILTILRQMGVKIEIDDFGSERASINSLLSVSPDTIKLDRGLVQAAVNDTTKRKVLSAILDMARALGIETLAEGVETQNDISVIQALGCHIFQGYAFARPMPEDALMAFLMHNTPALPSSRLTS